MALKKRGNTYYWRRKVGGEEFHAISLRTNLKGQSQSMVAVIRRAIKDRNPHMLSEAERAIVEKVFRGRVDEFLPGFTSEDSDAGVTLFDACKMLFDHPEVKAKDKKDRGRNATTYRERAKDVFLNLLEYFKPERKMSSIKVADIEMYRAWRLDQEAAPGTINKEVGILSKIFRVLIRRELAVYNPVRHSDLKPLSIKGSQRQVYIGKQDFEVILSHLPDWYGPLALLGYYAGMRAAEIRLLTRQQVDLKCRVIRLGAEDTKESSRKIVPLCVALVDMFKDHIMKSPVVGLERIFLKDGKPVEKDDFKRPWLNAVKKIQKPELNFHDLRHTWRRNARKSGMNPDICKAILGHSWRGKSVDEGYDLFDEDDFVQEIDKLRVDHGDTKIWVAKKAKKDTAKKRRNSKRGTKRGTVVGSDWIEMRLSG